MRFSNGLHSGSIWLVVVIVITATSANVQSKPTPPGQPLAGFGGRDYTFVDVRVTIYGEGAEAYWILEPRNRSKEPLPVVLFVHGLNLPHYASYRSWIHHTVKRGNVVIFPRYQASGLVDPKTFTAEAAKAARSAVAKCDGLDHAKADPDRLTMIGHSLGGTIIANLAARPEHFGLPAPGALMLLQTGDTKADRGLGALLPSISEDHSTIAEGTLMLVIDVENDWIVSPKAGQRILDAAEKVDATDKRRLLLRSDTHGEPALIAGHSVPVAWTNQPRRGRGSTDAFDYALWRWFDALQALADGHDDRRELVFGEAALDLGTWSDGKAVRPPIEPAAK
ncbi:MAG: hypothetical protein AAF711_14460 [Planctomycetota bacterium]